MPVTERVYAHAVYPTTTLAQLEAQIKEFGGPMLRLWWAPGSQKYCALFGVGVRTEALHAEADVLGFAALRGLKATCTEEDYDLVGRGDSIPEAINEAMTNLLNKYGGSLRGVNR